METSEAPNEDHSFSIHNDNFTFEELFARNITSEQLLSWSATLDLAENYEIFLNTPYKNESTERFFNCSWLWFGSRCQYSFYFVKGNTLADIVAYTFRTKGNQVVPRNLSCYIHLQCSTDSTSFCLDWREICDGRLACANGLDETNCELFEINECAENEYRCHDGTQCIPEDFFRDSTLEPDCLDGSDEPVGLSSSRCLYNPAFRCEKTNMSIRTYQL